MRNVRAGYVLYRALVVFYTCFYSFFIALSIIYQCHLTWFALSTLQCNSGQEQGAEVHACTQSLSHALQGGFTKKAGLGCPGSSVSSIYADC